MHMPREEVRFGSYDRLLGVAVHAHAWWLRHAVRVELAGGAPSWHDLSDCIAASAAAENRPDPWRVDADWARARAPVGLQLGLMQATLLTPIVLDFIAARVEGSTSVAYPFLLREREGRLLFGFSTAGPTLSVQQDIITAVGCRLLRA